MNLEIGTETNVNQFKQVVKSFFKLNPEKGENALITHVALKSNLDYDVFCEWRKENRRFR